MKTVLRFPNLVIFSLMVDLSVISAQTFTPTSLTFGYGSSLCNLEPTSTSDVCITLPENSTVSKVDVFILFDDTQKFATLPDIVTRFFPKIVADLQSALPEVDFGFGVGRFEDYNSFGGGGRDQPFILNQPIVTSADGDIEILISDALAQRAPGNGGDAPETALEALYQVATGNGFDRNGDGVTTGSPAGTRVAGAVDTQTTTNGYNGDVPAFSTLEPSVVSSGNVGGAGFRSDALKLVVLATDGCSVAPYNESIPHEIVSEFDTVMASEFDCSGRTGLVGDVAPENAATVPDTINALVDAGIRVIGLRKGSRSLPMLSGIARLTNAVDELGNPLVYSIGASVPTSIRKAIVEAVEITTARPVDINAHPVASCGVLEGLDLTSSGTARKVSPGETACFNLDIVNTNEELSGVCDVAFSTTDGIDLGTIPLGFTCASFQPLICGPSIVTDVCAILSLDCCDNTTGAIGPACCDTIPYDPQVSSCCGDGSLVDGVNNEAACAPSMEPSSPPTSVPSSMPSKRLTCEMVDPCRYELEEDQVNGLIVDDTYFPVCIQDDDKFHQKCYPESIIAGLGEGDPDPKDPDDRKIVICGCCPSIDELPEGIKSVKGSTDICKGGLDCIAAGTPFELSKSIKKIKFQMCIDGKEEYQNNFYVPDDDEVAYCGPCEADEILFV